MKLNPIGFRVKLADKNETWFGKTGIVQAVDANGTYCVRIDEGNPIWEYRENMRFLTPDGKVLEPGEYGTHSNLKAIVLWACTVEMVLGEDYVEEEHLNDAYELSALVDHAEHFLNARYPYPCHTWGWKSKQFGLWPDAENTAPLTEAG